MIKRVHNVVHIKQPCKDSCYAACIAMVTGESIDWILGELKAHDIELPLTEKSSIGVWVQKDIYVHKVTTPIEIFIPSDKFFIGMHLAGKGVLHAVLYYYESGEGVYYEFDPDSDYGRKTLTPDDFNETILIHVELLYDCESWRAE